MFGLNHRGQTFLALVRMRASDATMVAGCWQNAECFEDYGDFNGKVFDM